MNEGSAKEKVGEAWPQVKAAPVVPVVAKPRQKPNHISRRLSSEPYTSAGLGLDRNDRPHSLQLTTHLA